MTMATQGQTAKCEDCGKRVARFFGSGSRYPQGVSTATGGLICGECMGKRHEDEE